REDQTLALSARKRGAVLAQERVVPLGERVDERLNLAASGGLAHLRGVRVERAPNDILEDGGPEDDRLLQHQCHLRAEGRQGDPTQIMAVDGDASDLGIEEA